LPIDDISLQRRIGQRRDNNQYKAGGVEAGNQFAPELELKL
jgi:hypothetical protein